MKKIISVLLCTLFCISAFSQNISDNTKVGVKWETGTFNEALSKASKKDKMVFVDCYTVWCGPCKKMSEQVFPLKEAGDYFNSNFVNIKIDMEKGEGVTLKKRYNVSSYPTFLILNSRGEEMGRVVGSAELSKFISKVEKAKDIQNSPEYLKNVYDKDRSFDNAFIYTKALYDSRLIDQMKEFISGVVNEYKNSQIFSERMWFYYSKCLDVQTIYDHLINNRDEANIIVGKEKIDKLLLENSTGVLMKYITNRSTLNLERVREHIFTISLLAMPTDLFSLLIGKLANYFIHQEIDKILALYNIELLNNLSSSQLLSAEMIFASMKGITKENSINYYRSKEEFYSRKVRACAGKLKVLENAK